VRVGHELLQRGVGDVRDRDPRREPGVPERFRGPHVPDPGHELLALERLRQRQGGSPAQARDHLPELRRVVEDVRTEPPGDVVAQLQERAVPLHGLEFPPPQYEPGPAAQRRSARLNPPAPLHPQVAAEGHSALEAQQEVLADRIDTLEPASVEARGEVQGGGARVGRLDLDPLADERLEPAGGAMDAVSLGHVPGAGYAGHWFPGRRAARNQSVTAATHWLDAIGQIFHGIPDLAQPDEVQASLRRILDDPSLELFWWDWERGRYVDVQGEDAVEHLPERVVTLIEYETRKVGAIAHDARLLEQPEFLESFVPTMRIAMDRDRLHRDLVRKIAELKASRARIVKVADDERRRLERNLHDGAQQRLTVVLLALRRLEQSVEEHPELAPIVATARQELQDALEDLRELARGLHPPRLAQHGLAAAVRAASLRSSIPIALDLRLEDELPDEIGVAAYYVCAEAVANTVKHAQATKVELSIVQEHGSLTVDVADDGVGGACVDCDPSSTGLGGLIDRVEALDGTIEVVSPQGGGTRLIAVFPLARP
jgi:signal transduction histidine kinase